MAPHQVMRSFPKELISEEKISQPQGTAAGEHGAFRQLQMLFQIMNVYMS